jgi:hypothetical protein
VQSGRTGRTQAKEEDVNISGSHRTIATVLALIAALVILAGSAQAGSRPAGMSKADYRALLLRSQALNEKYGLGGATAGTPAGMTRAEYRALLLRSEGLNRKYGLGDSPVAVAPEAPTVVASDGFAWGDFGLGAAAMFGLILVAGGIVAGRRLPQTRVS